jgi:glycosyltransferase involved in cell wall biosynthesis
VSPRDDAGILAVVSDDWWSARQRRHQILSRLASRFLVAWISPPVHWREWLAQRAWANQKRIQAAPDPRMFVLEADADVPMMRHPAAVGQAILRRRVERGVKWLRQRGCRTFELQIWNPAFADALEWVSYATSSYHIDDEYSWSTVEQPMSDIERKLIERVDRVYVTSPKLRETKGGINANTLFSPNGVNYSAFASPLPTPPDVARIAQPRIGYAGVLKAQLDWELLVAIAKQSPSWSFVFVGPERGVHESIRAPLAALRALPNVHLLGERDARDLPAYVQSFDVALLPYQRNAYTDAINPMKLYEALAAGVPIVASRIRTLEEFSSVITFAEGVDEWRAAIAKSLGDGERSAERREERQAVARRFDWDVIAGAMGDSIEEALRFVRASAGPPDSADSKVSSRASRRGI